MTNQLSALLAAWHRQKSQDWVLGTVFKTEGSAYRKAGAMMLINGQGEHFGLLSGGCLEADIVVKARKVMLSGQATTWVYDGSDEDDLSFQLGIGCGGKVHIMLQPLLADNDLGLEAVRQALGQRQSGFYCQKMAANVGEFIAGSNARQGAAWLETRADGDWLITPITPEPHVLLVGGGIDARPLARLAVDMGWAVSLLDPRPANGRPEHFPAEVKLLRQLDNTAVRYITEQKVDAVVLMAHSIAIDGNALALLPQTAIRYLAALGPRHRFAKVLEHAGLQASELPFVVSSPAGLDIGGQLPESIALSILSGIHAALFKAGG
ncbi:XdhC family protein [Gallaecimonas mangrovi]|uniref:XdhC family protein n=1 Tax=Gallaecimonas mangrovi TaxID=2291597 RepID=UPI000E204822|nr:XdhC family protein [Gallaecimonas mangrovi]